MYLHKWDELDYEQLQLLLFKYLTENDLILASRLSPCIDENDISIKTYRTFVRSNKLYITSQCNVQENIKHK